jgi:acetoacetate decarboxylase
MKKADVLKQYTTPIAAPAFVQGPHRFKRREYLNITTGPTARRSKSWFRNRSKSTSRWFGSR